MPRDPRAILSPSFRAKLNQIKGLGPEEKALFERIGNVIDVLHFTQRQESNPRVQRRIVSTSIPTPRDVNLVGITGGIQVSWTPVDAPSVSFYEVQISETSTFAQNSTFEVLGRQMSFRGEPASGTLFIRLRTVTKEGRVSGWTQTTSSVTGGSTIFQADQDYIEPENRTTVSPKPKLLGTPTSPVAGALAFVGIGSHVGPSPLTLDDVNFDGNVLARNEVTYSLHEALSPYPETEQFRAPTIGEYIDPTENFYTFTDHFYMRFATLPSSITDFFTVTQPGFSPSTFDVEFLRYRLVNSFYSPQMHQAGYVFNAALSTIRF